jgi:hypothetical protein
MSLRHCSSSRSRAGFSASGILVCSGVWMPMICLAISRYVCVSILLVGTFANGYCGGNDGVVMSLPSIACMNVCISSIC